MLPAPANFLWQIIVGLVVTGIAALLSYLYRAKIALHWHRFKNYLFDTKVQLDLTRVDRYDEEPTKPLDMSFYHLLKQDFENISFEGLSDNCLRVSVPEIPTTLEIRIAHEPSLGDSHGNTERYELRVETQTPMTFGYRSDKCLLEFERVADDISHRAESRFPKTPKSTFLTGTLYGQAPIVDDEIEDEELGMRAELRDSTLELRFEDPHRLVRGIRKYFHPIQ